MLWIKIKKKHLRFHQILKRRLTLHLFQLQAKSPFLQKKKRPFRSNKSFNKTFTAPNAKLNPDNKKKNFARKFIEQQATKDFIVKDNKPAGKSKLKLKGPVDKRDFKLTVSRALNVEEIEIKQRSLASVKRARLK